MRFSEIVKQASTLLQDSGRVSYRALKVEFDLTDDLLDILKEELIDIREVAVEKDGKMLVWVTDEAPASPPSSSPPQPKSLELRAATSLAQLWQQ